LSQKNKHKIGDKTMSRTLSVFIDSIVGWKIISINCKAFDEWILTKKVGGIIITIRFYPVTKWLKEFSVYSINIRTHFFTQLIMPFMAMEIEGCNSAKTVNIKNINKQLDSLLFEEYEHFVHRLLLEYSIELEDRIEDGSESSKKIKIASKAFDTLEAINEYMSHKEFS
jgi:hypothetical protein